MYDELKSTLVIEGFQKTFDVNSDALIANTQNNENDEYLEIEISEENIEIYQIWKCKKCIYISIVLTHKICGEFKMKQEFVPDLKCCILNIVSIVTFHIFFLKK